MRIDDIIVEVRSSALGRLGQVSADYLTNLQLIKRYNNVGSWSLTLPIEYHMAQLLAAPGRGITVTGPNDVVLLSGSMLSFTHRESIDDPNGTWLFQGVDDMIHLSDALAWPEPSNPDPSTQLLSHDVRTGNCETVMRSYVSANIVPGVAPADRAIAGLVLETNMGRGLTVTGRARFDALGSLLGELASYGQLGFDMIQVDDEIRFHVYEPQDKSAIIRMDIDNDMLDSAEYGFGAPSGTRAIVAGQGQQVDRTFIMVTDVDAAAAEVAWARKIEIFKDRRDTDDPTELEQTGNEVIQTGGRTQKTLAVKPSDDVTMVYGVDWFLGDIVSVIVDDQPVTAVVTEAIISISAEGVRTAATIGDPTGFDYESRMIAKQQDQEKRLAFIEKNAEFGDTTWSTLGGVPTALKTDPGADRILFWDDSAGQLAHGTPVAPLSVSGTNIVVASASETVVGAVELATGAETITGTDNTRAVTPLGLQSLTATDTRDGIVELATNAETIAGTDATRAVTPASLAANVASATNQGLVELATTAEATTGTDTTRAVTAAGLLAALAARFLPYRIASGNSAANNTASGNSGGIFWNALQTITFPASRFTVTPILQVTIVDTTPGGGTITAGFTIEALTSSSFQIRINRLGATPPTTYRIHWTAIQMTSSTAEG